MLKTKVSFVLLRALRIEKFINSVTPTILGEQEPKHDYRANHTSM